MGIAERREREKEQRRNDIIDAAQTVFFSKGWNAATMDDVAEAAELSKATLYLYFKNKEELFAAILVRGNKILFSTFAEAVDGGETGLQKIEAIGRAYVRFFYEHPDYANAMNFFDCRGCATDHDNTYICERESLKEKTMALVAQAVKTGIDDGSIRPDIEPMKTAIILWAQTAGLLQILSVAHEDIKSHYRLESKELVEMYFDFTFHALAADPAKGLTGG